MADGIETHDPYHVGQTPEAVPSLKERLITKSTEPVLGDVVKTLRTIRQLNIKLTNVHKPIEQELQGLLDRLHGKQFDAYAERRR